MRDKKEVINNQNTFGNYSKGKLGHLNNEFEQTVKILQLIINSIKNCYYTCIVFTFDNL